MKIGFIGFGEAAYLISKGLIAEGLDEVCAFDVNANHPEHGLLIRQRAQELSVKLLPGLDTLCREANLIVCATSAKYARSIAEETSAYLTRNHVYVDMNATSPMAKEEIAAVLKTKEISSVDAAVMDAVPKHGHKVPMLLSGSGVSQFEAFGAPYGMNMTSVGTMPGRASAIKMARSIFMKGITMLFFETFALAREYDAVDIVMSSLSETMTASDLEETVNLLMTRTVNHAERRVAEMGEVQKTLQSLGLDTVMSEGTQAKLKHIADSDLQEFFHCQTPADFREVLAAMRQDEKGM
ncbi:DUF1932 domain-containing protein [Alicyclobacillus sp. SO9]|uniref:DUF1932 domain-containing protein n=1 Tax=Alicyclobacillus sp. SO9 TaxID=2665646 RepID=UPI0018E76192|nr:DUF1932 domain-containing protein [Alicyclobacillus sp. SO9]QQE77611.1 NAD(P)-dependent oxidoreductase [Alicyclobacillus sp. SO9]